jgi:tetratricopeptide (TPR) repeat protein
MISGDSAFASDAGVGKPAVCCIGLCSLLLLACLANLSAQERVRSHQERFASPTVKSKLAEAEATARLSKNPRDTKALTERGLARLSLGLVKAGIADFEQAIALDRTSSESWASLAYGLWMQGQLAPALAAAREALAKDPEYPSAHWYTGRLLLLTSGDLQEATKHLERALELKAEEAGIHLDLLMAYRAAGDLKRASAQLRPLRVSLSASDSRLLYAEGLLASDAGRSAFAIDRFRQALAANPQMLEAQNGLGGALVQAEQWQEAIEVLSPLAREQPQSFTVAYLLALALHHAQRRPEAEQEVRRALRLNPSSTEASTLLAKVVAQADH